MQLFWKAAVLVLLTVVLGATLGKREQDLALSLSLAACCMVLLVAMEYLGEVVAFLGKLGSAGGEGGLFLGTLLKIAGVALTAEVTGLLSADAGNHALDKAMQILGNAVILFLSLPLFEGFWDMIQEIMGYL